MTTYDPNHPQPGQITPREDPYANKTLAAFVTTICGLAIQFVSTGGEFQLDQEGTTAIVGGIATFLVWFVSNWKRKGV